VYESWHGVRVWVAARAMNGQLVESYRHPHPSIEDMLDLDTR
jgi:hypothetical protein